MARNAGTQSRNRSSSLSAAWSFFWKSKNSSSSSNSHGGHHGDGSAGNSGANAGLSHGINGNSKDHGATGEATSAREEQHRHPSTIQEEDDDDEDRALVKGVTRKVLPQRRATTVGVGGSGTTTRQDHSHQLHHYQQQQQQQQQSPPQQQQQQQQQHPSHMGSPASTASLSTLSPDGPRGLGLDQHRSSSMSASWVASYAPSYPSTALSYPILEGIAVKGGIKNVDSSHTVGTAHPCPGTPNAPPPPPPPSSPLTSQGSIGAKTMDFLSDQLSPGLQHSQQIIQFHTTPMQGQQQQQQQAYFDISPTTAASSSSASKALFSHHAPPAPPRNSSSRHPPSSQMSRWSETHSQSSALTAFIDDKDVELDENSFYLHLRRMQERAAAQHEPGWLRTQHAILQAKHRIPLGGFSSSPQTSDYTRDGNIGVGTSSSSNKRASLVPGSASSSSTSFSQPFLSMFQSSAGDQHQPHQQYDSSLRSRSSSHVSKLARQQPVLPFNCFQPNHVICVPREKSLGGLIFHKSFVDTHVLTPSPYFQGQFLTLDGKVVEIDRDVVRTKTGFAHSRVVQILAEECVYDSNSSRPTRVLILERPLEGDGQILAHPGLDGILLPPIRHFNGDLVFLQSFAELARALRDFNSLCLEFEKTYVYIRGFASFALDKLRIIYDKIHRDCLEDSVKLQKLVRQGSQTDQDAFSELIENVVMGKLYNKIFHQSLLPLYGFKDEEVDSIVTAYHQYFFSPGVHRGLMGGLSLAASESKRLQQTLRKLGVSEELQTLKIEQALEPAAALMRCWDSYVETDVRRLGVTKPRANPLDQDAEDAESIKKAYQQEQAKRQSPSSYRDSSRRSTTGNLQDSRPPSVRSTYLGRHSSEDDESGHRSILTPLEKVSSLKQMLDLIALGAEDHLLDRSGFGFARKKRSDVSVTTDDLIPLLTLAIILARPVNLSTNIFYIQRFRINKPRSEWSFSLVTLEASVEFLKTDPLEILGQRTNSMTLDSASTHSSQHLDSVGSSTLYSGGPQEWPALVPWGEPSETGWGFSPPKCSGSLPSTPAALDIPDPHSMHPTSVDTIPRRTPIMNGSKDDPASTFAAEQQSRHARSTSTTFDDRFENRTDAAEGSGQGSPFLRGIRLSSGSGSPAGYPRANALRSSLPPQHSPHYQHRITIDQSKDPYGSSAVLQLQPSSMTMGGSHLVVKPQIVLPAPKTPPASSQKAQPTRMRSRPMSMVVSGSSPLAQSYTNSSATGVGALLHARQNSYGSSNQSSPATSPQLGPPRFVNSNGNGTMDRRSSVRSNSFTTAPFPVLRTNSMTSVMAIQATAEAAVTASQKQDNASDQPPQSQLEQSPSLGNMSLSSPPNSGSATVPSSAHRASPTRPTVKTSPSRTTTSISTPSTPTIFTPVSSPVLRAALAGGATGGIVSTLQQHIQQASAPPPKGVKEGGSLLEIENPSPSSLNSGGESNALQQQPSPSRSSLDRSPPARLVLPLISPPPSQPSTASCKESEMVVSLSPAGVEPTSGSTLTPATLMLTTPTGSTSTADLCLFSGINVHNDQEHTDPAKPCKLVESSSLSQLDLASTLPSSSTGVDGGSLDGWGSKGGRKTVSSPASPLVEYNAPFSYLTAEVPPDYVFATSSASSSSLLSEQDKLHTPELAGGAAATTSDSGVLLLPPHVLTHSPEMAHATLAGSAPTAATPTDSLPDSSSEKAFASSTFMEITSGSIPAKTGEQRHSRESGRAWQGLSHSQIGNTNSNNSSVTTRTKVKPLQLDESRLPAKASAHSGPNAMSTVGGGGGGGSVRRQAPEIIPLPSPLLGDIVHRKGEATAGPTGSGASYMNGSYSGLMSSSPNWAAMTHAMRRGSGSGGADYPSRRSFESPLSSSSSSSKFAGPMSGSSSHHQQHQQHHQPQYLSGSSLLSASGHTGATATATATAATATGFEASSFSSIGSRSPNDRRASSVLSNGSSRQPPPQQLTPFQAPPGVGQVHPFVIPDQEQGGVADLLGSHSGMKCHLDGLGIRTGSPAPMQSDGQPHSMTMSPGERWGGGGGGKAGGDGSGHHFKMDSGKYAGQHGGGSEEGLSPTTLGLEHLLVEKEETLLNHIEESRATTTSMYGRKEKSPPASQSGFSHSGPPAAPPPPRSYSPLPLESAGAKAGSTPASRRSIVFHHPQGASSSSSSSSPRIGPLELASSSACSSAAAGLSRGAWHRTSASSVHSLNLHGQQQQSQQQQQQQGSRRSSTNHLATPLATVQIELSSSLSQMEQQQKARLMLGDFLSELANAKDGDIVVGCGAERM